MNQITPKKPKRKWRNLFLDNSVQLRLVLTMLALASVVMALVGIWAYQKSLEATEVAYVQIDSVSCTKKENRLIAGTATVDKSANADVPPPIEPEAKTEVEKSDKKKKFSVKITSSEMEIKDVEPSAIDDENNKNEASIQAVDEECVALMAATKKKIARRQTQITGWLLLSGVALLALLFFVGIKGTHRIVGPLFRVRRELLKMKSNDFQDPYDLRQKDRLKVFFGKFKNAHAHLKLMHKEDIDQLKSIQLLLSAMDSSQWSKEQVAIKRQIDERLEALEAKA